MDREFNHIRNGNLNFDLETAESLSQRFYVTPEGNKYPSVTTILKEYNKEAIEQWRAKVGEEEANRVSRKASTRGGGVHDLCERYILNEEINYQSIPIPIRVPFMAIQRAIDKSLDDIVCLEQALYSDKLRAAGRVDCIGRWDGKLAVVDFKTSLKEKKEEWIKSYFMQCTTYACMYFELTGERINDIVVLIGCDGLRYPQVFHRKIKDYLGDTLTFIENYHRMNDKRN